MVVLKGDVDGDGEITMDDAIAVLNNVLGEDSVIDTSALAEFAANTDAEAELTMDDAIQILNKVLGEDSSLDI